MTSVAVQQEKSYSSRTSADRWKGLCYLVGRRQRTNSNLKDWRQAISLAAEGAVTIFESQMDEAEGIYAIVEEDSVSYAISTEGHCECRASRERSTTCAHVLATYVQGVAMERFNNSSTEVEEPWEERQELQDWLNSHNNTPRRQEAPTMSIENPAGANFKLRIGPAEVWFTWHGQTDEEVLTRMRNTLPELRTMLASFEGMAPVAPVAPVAPPTATPPPTPKEDICPIHNVTMQKHEQKGDIWSSHPNGKGENGKTRYCRGE